MSAKFVNIDRDTPMLLPPDLREWLPEDHLVHFLLEVVDTMDTGEFRVNHRGTGSRQYPPSMMLSLLVCKHSAMSHGHAVKVLEQLECEVKELTARAEEADLQEHSQCETKLPEEIARRKQRMARIREAVDVIEDREKEKADQERQRRKAKAQERKERRERGEKVTGPEPREVEDKIDPKAQYNFTDPERPDQSPRQKMKNKLSTPQGRERYGLRKETVEPVFGIIKEVMRFRQ
jgi:hypothetical protein